MQRMVEGGDEGRVGRETVVDTDLFEQIEQGTVHEWMCFSLGAGEKDAVDATVTCTDVDEVSVVERGLSCEGQRTVVGPQAGVDSTPGLLCAETCVVDAFSKTPAMARGG